MELIELGFIGLFIAAFLAATILPFASEGVLVGMLYIGYDPIICFVIASIANTLGGYTNYFIGKLGNESFVKKQFKSPEKYLRFKNRIQKYGSLFGFLSWVPVIGDPLTIALGYFRVPFVSTAIYILLGKSFRYLLIIFIWNS